jgi:hypothetical protein
MPIQRSCSYQGGYGGDEANWKVKARWNNPVVPQPATSSVLLKRFLFVTLFFVGELQGGGRGSRVEPLSSKLRVWETSAEMWRLAKRGGGQRGSDCNGVVPA